MGGGRGNKLKSKTERGGEGGKGRGGGEGLSHEWGCLIIVIDAASIRPGRGDNTDCPQNCWFFFPLSRCVVCAPQAGDGGG